MKGFKSLFIYLFSLILLVGTTGCSDEIIPNGTQTDGKPFSGTLSLNVSAGAAGVSSRSLNMNDGATININSLWIGVFDKSTGKRIGATRIDGFNATVSGGVPSRNMVTVDFYSDYSNPEVFVVGVANYDDVTTREKTPVIDAIQAADSWNDLVEIDIDAVSAYAGDKGEDKVAQTPFLMGYYLESAGMSRVPKFNQLESSGEGGISIYPENASTAMTIKLFTDENGGLHVPAGALTLRRLVSNINVNLVAGAGIEISDVSFKVFNQPQTIYLVQRRTDTSSARTFDDWKRFSPNRSDCFITESGEFENEPVYIDDMDWRTDVSTDGKSFSFQHFENKHWGFGNINSFSEREAKNPDGTLKALSPEGSKPYNAYASYFKIRMHITDRNTGRNGDVIYTIHEGLCNTDDGRKADSEDVKMKDFGSFRNTNYTYTINVNGMENIVVNTYLEDDNEDDHNNGQEGKVWQIVYANGDNRQIPEAGGTYGEIRFKDSAIPAFRLYGTDDDGQRFDLCYNFPDHGASLLGGFWPENDSHTVITNNPADLVKLPASMLAGIKITDGTRDYTIEEFLTDFDHSKTYKFKFSAYNGPWEDEPRENMRALYLFDKNELREDFDGCSLYGKIYAAEQYPLDTRPGISFNKNNTIGHTAMHATSENKWCGCVNSVVELIWAHDSSFEGYFIEVGGIREKITKESLPSYIKTVNGKQAVVYPYVTDRIAGSETPYDVTITPIPSNKAYKGEPTVVSGMLAVYPSKWIIKSTPLWKDLNVNGKTNIDVEYRGLEMFQNNSTSNASVKGSYLSFGGSANLTNRVLRFYTVKSGKLTTTVCSNATLPSGASSSSLDTSRYMLAALVKYDENGNQIILKSISLEEQYVPYNNTTADRVFDITIDEPCYVYVYMTGGNIRVYGITFDAY